MRQDKSTDQQLTEIRAFCKQHGLILRHQFVDEAKSGGSTAGVMISTA
jgi:DNA invertase Pin-like site-specific DNA recombinase